MAGEEGGRPRTGDQVSEIRQKPRYPSPVERPERRTEVLGEWQEVGE